MKLHKDFALFLRGISEILTSSFFVWLSLLGNGVIGFCGWLFYIIERGTNPQVSNFMDGLWWAFATATTTGFGDVTPVTTSGRVLGIFLMLLGLALFAMYTALFAEIILSIKRHKISDNN